MGGGRTQVSLDNCPLGTLELDYTLCDGMCDHFVSGHRLVDVLMQLPPPP